MGKKRKRIVSFEEKEAVLEAEQIAKEMGAKKVVVLKTAGPFHTEKLIDASNALKNELENITIKEFKSKVIKNIDGAPYADENNMVEILSNHIVYLFLFVLIILDSLFFK